MKLFLNKSNKGKYKVAQRVLSFKKKTRLTVMNMHSKLLNNHSVHPPLSAGERSWGGGETPNKFSKMRAGGLTGPQLLVGVCWKSGSDLIQEGCNFHLKKNQILKYLTEKTFIRKHIFPCHNY